MKIDKKSARMWSMIGPTGLFGVIMNELAKENDKLSVVTADLSTFSGLDRFGKEYPDKIYNVGIAEQNMMGIAAGLAQEGLTVFAATYASFLVTRSLDQLRISMGYMNLPIKLVGLTAGYASGILGATHMALEDIAILRSIPNITILSPADCVEAVKCMEAVSNYPKPVYIRLTGTARMPMIYLQDYNYQIGKNQILREGTDISILATGSMVSTAIQVSEQLETLGISAEVINIHTIKPFDLEVLKNRKNRRLIVTVEEHSIIGGLGTIVAEEMINLNYSTKLLKIGIEEGYLHAASYTSLLEKSGLTKEHILERILSVLK